MQWTAAHRKFWSLLYHKKFLPEIVSTLSTSTNEHTTRVQENTVAYRRTEESTSTTNAHTIRIQDRTVPYREI